MSDDAGILNSFLWILFSHTILVIYASAYAIVRWVDAVLIFALYYSTHTRFSNKGMWSSSFHRHEFSTPLGKSPMLRRKILVSSSITSFLYNFVRVFTVSIRNHSNKWCRPACVHIQLFYNDWKVISIGITPRILPNISPSEFRLALERNFVRDATHAPPH